MLVFQILNRHVCCPGFVEWLPYGFGEEEVMVFGLDTKVLKNRIRPKSLHVIPVLDLAVSDGIVDAITGATTSGQSLITDEEIQVLGATLCGKV